MSHDRATQSCLTSATRWRTHAANLREHAALAHLLASGQLPVSATMEANIRALTGADDPLDLDVAFPRDEWILGDGPDIDGLRREYLVHTRRPRFIARVVSNDGITPEARADVGTGVTYTSDDYILCEIVWMDPPPGPVALAALMEAACDAIDAAA